MNFSGDNEAFIKEIFKDLMSLFRTQEEADGSYNINWGSSHLATVFFEGGNKARVVFVKDDYGRAICGLVKDRHPEKFQ